MRTSTEIPDRDPSGMIETAAGATAPLIAVSGVSKSYGATKALDAMDFELSAGEIHALCGHNGAGKSTLVKLLAGLIKPDSGVVEISGKVAEIYSPSASQQCGIAVVEQELALAETLTVADNVFLGHPDTPWLYRRQRHLARQYLDQVGLHEVDGDTGLSELRLGQRQLVEIARLLARNARILILDEPTATLSRDEIDRVFGVVRTLVSNGCAAIFVTHRLGEVFEFCDRVTVVRDGSAIATRNTADLDRDGLVSLMVDGEPAVLSSNATVERVGPPVLSIEKLSVPGAAADVNLEVGSGQIVALAGQVGAGATEVLRAVVGLDPDAEGLILMNGADLPLGDRRRSRRRGVEYVSEDRAADGLFFGRSAAENLTATSLPGLGRFGWIPIKTLHAAARRLAGQAHLAPNRLAATPEMLSGGNQQKLLVGRCLAAGRTGPKALLLSEPTRGVDIHSRHEIYQVLRDVANNGSGVLFTSTDLDEIFDLADVIYTMFRGAVVARYERGEATISGVLADMTHGPSATDLGEVKA